MHSHTKAVVTSEQLSQMISIAGITNVEKIEELTGGEFNLAYMIYTNTCRYIIKIAPPQSTFTLTYEHNIMDIELWAYQQLRQATTIPIPDIIYEGHDVIGNHWFVMTVMPGKLLCDAKLNYSEMYHWQYQFGQALAQIHNIKHTSYGYQQNTMHKTWKDAYYDMVFNLIDDAQKQGNVLPDLARILRFIRKWDYTLDEVDCPRLIHFDLFSNNVFIDDDGNFAGLIDTERCFFGDIYADLFAITFLKPVQDNKGLIDGYNSVSEVKISFTTSTRARIALYRLYLGLLMFTEGTTRLALADPQHWSRKYLASRVIDFALNEVN